MEALEKLLWVAKNSFMIVGVAACLLLPFSVDPFLLFLHRFSLLIPLALWLCLWLGLCKKEVAGISNRTVVVVPQVAPAPPVASSADNFYDFLFFKPREEEEEQRREHFDVDDEPSAASPGPAWWLSEPVLVDSAVWMAGADVSPSAPPIATAYSASFFDECCGGRPPFPSEAEGGREHSKSMDETWEAICLMKKEKGRRAVKEEEAGGGGRRTREVPAVKKDELFRQVDAFIKNQRKIFEFDLQQEESPARWPRRAGELDRRRQLPRP